MSASASATPPVVLSIAGSDPSGGAGIQADLKTFAAFEVYGAAVVTCATAQNTRGVRAVHPLPADFVAAEIDAVIEDLPVRVVKTGMIGSAPIADVVVDRLTAVRGRGIAIVVDPVCAATSGDRLIDDDALTIVRERLLPIATLVTPNLAEAALLARVAGPLDSDAAVRAAALAISALGAHAVLVKGGHRSGPACDLLVDDGGFVELVAPRLPIERTHGSGCTLSAAIAAALALGLDLRAAVAAAKRFVHEAIRSAPAIGGGARPLDHRVRPRLL